MTARSRTLANRHARLLASLTLALAVGCGAAPTEHIPPTTTTAAPAPAALPTTVDIPAIGVHATHLEPLGLDKNGAIETPPLNQPQTLGYYTSGGAPCQPGPQQIPFALIGHIDGQGRQGVLFNLKNLKPGDTVTIGLDNGRSCTYRISKLAEYRKDQFPTDDVWGPVADSEIRVVSCGGPYIGPPSYYRDNLVGMGTLAS